MKRVQKALVGAVTGAALLASASFTQAQDAADTNSSAIGAGAQPTMQYCMPGCVVGPMTDADMHYGMMGQGMMGPTMMPMMAPGMMSQGAMPMMMAPGMMGQGTMPMMMAPGMMGQGAMPMMMAPGMMGQGAMPMMMMAPGTMGQGMMGQGTTPMMGAEPMSLEPDQVRPHLEQHLAMMGLPNLVLGSVEAQDDDTLVAEIVTRDGMLVQRLAIDRHTGAVVPLE